MTYNKLLIPFSEMFSRGVGWLFISTMPIFIESKIYGLIVLIYSLEIIFTNGFILGQDKFILRYFRESNKILESVAIVSTLFVFLIVTVWILLPIIIDYRFSIWHVLIYSLSIFLTNINRLYLSKYRIEHKVFEFSIQRIVGITIRVLVFYTFIYLDFDIVASFIFSQLASNITISILYIKELYFEFSKSSLDSVNIKKCIKFGWPISLHLFSTAMISHADKFIINEFFDSSQVGIYAFSYMIGSGFTFVLAALSIYYEPNIYKFSSSEFKQEKEISKFYRLSFVGLTIYIFILCVISLIVNNLNLEVYYLEEIVFVSLLSHFLNSIYLKSSYRLYSQEKSINVSLVTIFASIVNVCANFYLIPILNLKGAVISTLISSTILSLVMSYTSLNDKSKFRNDIFWVVLVWFISLMILTGSII